MHDPYDCRPLPWCPECDCDASYTDDTSGWCICPNCGHKWEEDFDPGDPDYDAVPFAERYTEAWMEKRYG